MGSLFLLAGIFVCTADSPTVPDIIGNWVGTSVGHDRVHGYLEYPGYDLLMSITKQQGRVFNGTLTVRNRVTGTTDEPEGFSGVFGPDRKTLFLSEYNSGFDIGQLIDENTLEIIYLEGGDNAMAFIDTFTREVS